MVLIVIMTVLIVIAMMLIMNVTVLIVIMTVLMMIMTVLIVIVIALIVITTVSMMSMMMTLTPIRWRCRRCSSFPCQPTGSRLSSGRPSRLLADWQKWWLYNKPFIHPSIHPSSIHPCILFNHPFIHPLIHPSIHPCILSNLPFIHPLIHPSIHPHLWNWQHPLQVRCTCLWPSWPSSSPLSVVPSPGATPRAPLPSEPLHDDDDDDDDDGVDDDYYYYSCCCYCKSLILHVAAYTGHIVLLS